MTSLRAALEKIIEMNIQYAKDRYGDASKAEEMACVKVARAALAAAPPAADSRDTFERILASLHYDGDDIDSLTVGEIRRALP